MVNTHTPKILDRADLLLDLAGPVFGVAFLVIGIGAYRDGGSVGWPVAGAAILLVTLGTVGRALARRRRGRARQGA